MEKVEALDCPDEACRGDRPVAPTGDRPADISPAQAPKRSMAERKTEDMRSKFSLTLEDVHKIVAACRREADKVARAATIAVVDGSGVLMYLERPDDQPANSVDMATGKARTAAFRERPSSSLEARVKERPGFLTYPNAIAVTGGVPLFYEGQCVGGVGVSGIADGDEVVAKAGAEALS